MNKAFKTYEDLELEKKRLRDRLSFQQQKIREDFREIKEKLEPAGKILSFAGNLTTRNKANPLLQLGMNLGIDLLSSRFIFSKAGWLGKLAIPFIAKNYASHLLPNGKFSLFDGIKKFFSKKDSGRD
jgi:hypothetical protein